MWTDECGHWCEAKAEAAKEFRLHGSLVYVIKLPIMITDIAKTIINYYSSIVSGYGYVWEQYSEKQVHTSTS